MLVLSRKVGQSITLDGGIVVTFCGMRGNGEGKIGIDAPKHIRIARTETIGQWQPPFQSPPEKEQSA